MNAANSHITGGLSSTPSALLIPGFFGGRSTPPAPVYVHPLFSNSDLLGILTATGGESITATTGGTTTTLTAKYRDTYETSSPWETDTGLQAPSILIRHSDYNTYVTRQSTFTVRGVSYRMVGKERHLNDGFTRIYLGRSS